MKFDFEKAMNMPLKEYKKYRKAFLGDKTIYTHEIYNIKYIYKTEDAILIAGKEDNTELILRAVEDLKTSQVDLDVNWEAVIHMVRNEENLSKENKKTRSIMLFYDVLAATFEMNKEKYVLWSIDKCLDDPDFEEFKRKVDAGEAESVFTLLTKPNDDE